VTLNISGGEVLFSNSSSLTINKSVGTLNGGATLKIAGALTYGNGTIAVTWAPSAVVNNSNFTYDPTSVTFGTGTYSLISTGSFSRIELQQGITTGYSGVFVGSTSTGGGSGSGEVYLNASQISIAAPVTMGAAYTGTNTLTGTYTVGMDVSSAATGTVSGNITLLEPSSAGTQTDNFDVATSNTLTVSGAIANKVTGTGSAATSTVTKTSGGTLILSNTGNSYSSPTTVSAGSLLAANGSTGSAVGTGSLTVASGATIGGYSASASTSRVGTFKSYGFTIGTGGSAANVIVGDGTDATSSLALESITGYSGTFTGSANLVFNLDSASTHSNVLTVAESGSSNSVVFKGATLTLNVIGSGGIITSGTQYDLINDASGFNASTDGLTLVTNSMNQQVITSGLSLASNTYFGSGGFYSPSYLFLSSDDTEIEVEVVPEPSTWAMLMGGAAGLALVLRRRARGAV
jgi:autotransporter-associated beta strand protein